MEKERIKARLLAEPDSEWSLNFKAKRKAQQKRWIARNQEAKNRHGKAYYDKHRVKLVAKNVALKRQKKIKNGWIPRKLQTKEESNARVRKWVFDNRERLNSKLRDRRASDPSFKIRCNLRTRLSTLLRLASTKKTSQTLTLLGCPLPSFMLYLESKFEAGMTWENYGEWHIDHIMPCAIFDLTQPEHQKRCFHFSNMQPLWAQDNRRKSDSIPDAAGSREGGGVFQKSRSLDSVKTRIRFTV
jgi:hypothetical protein